MAFCIARASKRGPGRRQEARRKAFKGCLTRVRQFVRQSTLRARIRAVKKKNDIKALGRGPRLQPEPEAVGRGTLHAAQPRQAGTPFVCPTCAAVVWGTWSTRVNCQHKTPDGDICSTERWRVKARTYLHACPSCTTHVRTTVAHGRVRVKHNRPDGRECLFSDWTAKRTIESGLP